jgi:hypothetical protein
MRKKQFFGTEKNYIIVNFDTVMFLQHYKKSRNNVLKAKAPIRKSKAFSTST